MLNPITKDVKHLAFYFVLWTAIACIHATILFFLLSIELIPAIIDGVVSNFTYGIFLLATWSLVSFSSLEKTHLINTIITHIAGASVLIAIAVFVVSKSLNLLLTDDPNYSSFLQDSIFWRVAVGAIFYMFLVINLYVYMYNEEFKQKSVDEAELKRSLKETELNMLKSQLNPHFIFNSLNSISSLTLTNPEKAQEMVINLSEFLRYSIKPIQEKLIPLKHELDAIHKFIEIEKVRFGDRLQIKIECPIDCSDKLLPPLIIQPLIENAIKYGVHETIDNGAVSLSCSCNKSVLEVIVQNNYDSEGVPAVKTGIGLKNVANRLSLLFGTEELIQIDKQSSLFTVKLFIPQS